MRVSLMYVFHIFKAIISPHLFTGRLRTLVHSALHNATLFQALLTIQIYVYIHALVLAPEFLHLIPLGKFPFRLAVVFTNR
jgi:hypothetical protein